jgi:hypothetical protein
MVNMRVVKYQRIGYGETISIVLNKITLNPVVKYKWHTPNKYLFVNMVTARCS